MATRSLRFDGSPHGHRPAGRSFLVACGNTCLALDPGRSEDGSLQEWGITGGDISSITTEATQPPTFYVHHEGGRVQSNDARKLLAIHFRSLRIAPVLFGTHPSIKTRLVCVRRPGDWLFSTDGVRRGRSRGLSLPMAVHSLTFSPPTPLILGATWSDGVVVSADGDSTGRDAVRLQPIVSTWSRSTTRS